MSDLISLAARRFPDLSVRERDILARASLSDPNFLHTAEHAEQDGLARIVRMPTDPRDEKLFQRTMRILKRRSTFAYAPKVRSSLISWLVSSEETRSLVPCPWVEVTDCVIDDTIRLGHDKAHTALGLRRAWLKRGIILRYADFRNLSFFHVRIDATREKDPEGLRDRSEPPDEREKQHGVAIIAESLSLDGTAAFDRCLINGAIYAPGITTKSGDINISRSFVRGSIDLSYAKLSGNFFLTSVSVRATPIYRSQHEDSTSAALEMTGASITRDFALSAYLSNNNQVDEASEVLGQLRLVQMQIGGSLAISGTNLFAERADRAWKRGRRDARRSDNVPETISASSVRISGNLRLADGTQCNGSVDFLDLSAHSVTVDLGSLLTLQGSRLCLDDTNVQNRLELINTPQINNSEAPKQERSNVQAEDARQQLRQARTRILLRSARTRIFQCDSHCWPQKGCLFIEGFKYEKLEPGSDSDWTKFIKLQSRFYPSNYDTLAQFWRSQGFDVRYTETLVEKEKSRLKSYSIERIGLFSYFYNSIKDYLWYIVSDFGYRPSRSVFWLVMLWIATTYILFQAHRTEFIVVEVEQESISTEIPNYDDDFSSIEVRRRSQNDSERQVDPFNPLIEALQLALPIVKFPHTEEWSINLEKGDVVPWLAKYHLEATWGQVLRWYSWAATGLAWFFGIFFAAAVAGLTRKD